jgi:8-oxo-dGTP diphosphatase
MRLSATEVPKVRVVAALIQDPQYPQRYLVQQRLPGGSRGSLWEFPGGKVEPRESDQAALIRECREELGVELTVGSDQWRGTHHYRDLRVELVLYAATIRAGVPRPLRAQQLRYLSPKEMAELPFCEADLPLIEALSTAESGPANNDS